MRIVIPLGNQVHVYMYLQQIAHENNWMQPTTKVDDNFAVHAKIDKKVQINFENFYS